MARAFPVMMATEASYPGKDNSGEKFTQYPGCYLAGSHQSSYRPLERRKWTSEWLLCAKLCRVFLCTLNSWNVPQNHWDRIILSFDNWDVATGCFKVTAAQGCMGNIAGFYLTAPPHMGDAVPQSSGHICKQFTLCLKAFKDFQG